MAASTARDTNPPATNDAATNELKREQEVADKEIPVQQQDPDGKGVNPSQKGPAQPG
jgi:hypothetical protein